MSFLAVGVDIKDNFTPAQTFPTVGSLVDVLLKNIFTVFGLLLFLLLLFSGLKFIMGNQSGNEQEMEKSKAAITAALVGLLIVFCAYWIVEIIQFITGVKIFDSGI